jgi:hypothetical protein
VVAFTALFVMLTVAADNVWPVEPLEDDVPSTLDPRTATAAVATASDDLEYFTERYPNFN